MRARVAGYEATTIDFESQKIRWSTRWHAYHNDCGWSEDLTYWHNAFWAADHHMRYDCGRREPSSGDLTYQEKADRAQTPFWLGHPHQPGWYIRDGWGSIKLVKGVEDALAGTCPACNGSGMGLGRYGNSTWCRTYSGTGATHWDMTPVPMDFNEGGMRSDPTPPESQGVVSRMVRGYWDQHIEPLILGRGDIRGGVLGDRGTEGQGYGAGHGRQG